MSIALPAKTGTNVYQAVAMGAICLVVGLFCMKPFNPNGRIRDAVENRDFAAVESELKKGANPNARFRKKGEQCYFSLLHCAVGGGETGYGDPRITELLLKSGAIVDDPDSDGRTPLMWSVKADSEASVACSELLLKYGADITFKRDKTNALYEASVSCHTNQIKLLLKNGAKVNATDDSGDTALHRLCRFGYLFNRAKQLPAIRVLLDGGADSNMKNKDGLTPRDILVQEKTTDVISEYDAAIAARNRPAAP